MSDAFLRCGHWASAGCHCLLPGAMIFDDPLARRVSKPAATTAGGVRKGLRALRQFSSHFALGHGLNSRKLLVVEIEHDD